MPAKDPPEPLAGRPPEKREHDKLAESNKPVVPARPMLPRLAAPARPRAEDLPRSGESTSWPPPADAWVAGGAPQRRVRPAKRRRGAASSRRPLRLRSLEQQAARRVLLSMNRTSAAAEPGDNTFGTIGASRPPRPSRTPALANRHGQPTAPTPRRTLIARIFAARSVFALTSTRSSPDPTVVGLRPVPTAAPAPASPHPGAPTAPDTTAATSTAAAPVGAASTLAEPAATAPVIAVPVEAPEPLPAATPASQGSLVPPGPDPSAAADLEFAGLALVRATGAAYLGSSDGAELAEPRRRNKRRALVLAGGVAAAVVAIVAITIGSGPGGSDATARPDESAVVRSVGPDGQATAITVTAPTTTIGGRPVVVVPGANGGTQQLPVLALVTTAAGSTTVVSTTTRTSTSGPTAARIQVAATSNSTSNADGPPSTDPETDTDTGSSDSSELVPAAGPTNTATVVTGLSPLSGWVLLTTAPAPANPKQPAQPTSRSAPAAAAPVTTATTRLANPPVTAPRTTATSQPAAPRTTFVPPTTPSVTPTTAPARGAAPTTTTAPTCAAVAEPASVLVNAARPTAVTSRRCPCRPKNPVPTSQTRSPADLTPNRCRR